MLGVLVVKTWCELLPKPLVLNIVGSALPGACITWIGATLGAPLGTVRRTGTSPGFTLVLEVVVVVAAFTRDDDKINLCGLIPLRSDV